MIRFSLVFCLGVMVADRAGAADAQTPIGRQVDGFTLKDFRGKSHALSDYQESKLMVVAFMGLAIPMITSALALASTLSIDSQVKTGILKSQYSAMGADEYALNVIEQGLPPGAYPITLNGEPVTVTIGALPPPVPAPPPADNSRKLQTSKVVTPTVAVPSTLTTFTYTITVRNGDDDPENLTQIHDLLPTGFSYVAGSTSGITTADPSIVGQQLTWGLGLLLNPGDSVTLTFDAQASVIEGNYCNEAWVEPGQMKTSSGLTARIEVGSPSDDLCPGTAVEVTKTVEVEAGTILPTTPVTFTYTITIENTGTGDLHPTEVRDLLPVGFTYVPGTTSGEITVANPSTTMFQGRQRLIWEISAPRTHMHSGDPKQTVVFDVQGVFTGGHWNEAWVTFEAGEFTDTIYTWPSAGVQVLSVAESTSTTADGTTVYSQVWQLGPDSYILWEWEISG